MIEPLTSSASSASQIGGDEFQFLCALAGTNLLLGQIARIANRDLNTFDWTDFIRRADYHGVLPLATRNLIEHAHGLPSELEALLRSEYATNLKRSLWFASELTRIQRHFESKHVPSVPYKGPVLAQDAYGDVALRSFSDLDFLISVSFFEPAKQALAEIGYGPASDLTPAVERFWLQKGNERSFNSAAGQNLVELQWAILPYFFAIDLRVEDPIGRAGRSMVAGCEIPCLSPEDSVLILCLHAAKHLWARLIWLVDIAETLRSHTVDYAVVMERARRLGVARILAVSFWLAKNVLGTALPRLAEEMMAADPQVAVLGPEFAQRLARGATYDFESTEYFRLFLKLRERLSDRLRYIWRLIWTPGVGDIAAIDVPKPLFWMYRIVRLGRLTLKLFKSHH